MYKKRKKNLSDFTAYCKAELTRVKKSRHASSHHKTVKSYQKCLAKKGIKTGLPSKVVKKITNKS